MAKPALLVFGGLASTTCLYYSLQLWRVQRRLSQQLSHYTESNDNQPELVTDLEKSSQIRSLPSDILHNPSRYLVIYDSASKSIPSDVVLAAFSNGASHEEATLSKIFTAYSRHSMARFSSLPQAYIIRNLATAAAPDASSRKRVSESFKPDVISKLDFEKGDLLNGSYEVVLREPHRVEYQMVFPGSQGKDRIEGRLVITMDQKKDRLTFTTQTIMWRLRESKAVMPLEHGLAKWAHEITSWWLIDQGAKHLIETADQERTKKLQ